MNQIVKIPPQQRTMRPEDMPDWYDMRVHGDCLAPFIEHGQLVRCNSFERARDGELCVLFLNPEYLRPGEAQVQLKRLVLGLPHAFWRPPCRAGSGGVRHGICKRTKKRWMG